MLLYFRPASKKINTIFGSLSWVDKNGFVKISNLFPDGFVPDLYFVVLFDAGDDFRMDAV